MSRNTKKIVVFAVLAVATGMVDLASDDAKAQTMTRAQAYAAARVDTTFDVVASMPATAPFTIPMATKGDIQIPERCTAKVGGHSAQCVDLAYAMPTTPSIVLETSEGTTTTLMRMDAMTLAGMPDGTLQQSE